MQNVKCKIKICSLFTVHCNRAGFTLIELLLVLFIIGIASALVGVFIQKGRGNIELTTLAKEISATLRYARTHAITEKKTYSFFIWGEEKAYGLYADASQTIYKKFPSENLEATLKDGDATTIKIDFFPQGKSSGGTIEIKSTSGPAFFISVSKVTGKIELKKIQNSK